MSSESPPICPACGDNNRMMPHSDGQWYCHATHRIDEPITHAKEVSSNEQPTKALAPQPSVGPTPAGGGTPRTDIRMLDLARQLERELAAKTAECEQLKVLLPKLKAPCAYCGLKEISKCAHGFPGCPQADDLIAGEDEEFRRISNERNDIRAQLAESEQACQHHLETIAELKSIFSEILRAIDNGSGCSTNSSLEFLKHIPGEVGTVFSDLRADNEKLLQKIAELRKDKERLDWIKQELVSSHPEDNGKKLEEIIYNLTQKR